MCRVSEKIKFCTCDLKDKATLKDYWGFHSFDREKDNYIIGIASLPVFLDISDEEHNRKLLLERVNEPGAFDIDLKPKSKDRLEISLHFKKEGHENHLVYGFEFKKGSWVECGYDFHEWKWHHDEKCSGEVKDAF